MNARLFLALWVAGLPGIVAAAVLVLPQIVAGHHLPISLPLVELASAAQSAVFLALFVMVGVVLAPMVALHAPAFEAWLLHRPVAAALRPQIAPGLLGGILGGIVYGTMLLPLGVSEVAVHDVAVVPFIEHQHPALVDMRMEVAMPGLPL